MARFAHILGLAVFIAAIAFSFTACGDDEEETVPIIIESSLPIEMVNVPGGSFEMGKNLGTGGGIDATPVHTVTLTGFKMSKYQVTQEQYQEVMGNNPSNFKSSPASGEVQGKRSVECVSWYDVIEFCNALSVKEGLSPYYSIDKVNKDPNNTNSEDTVKWTITLNSSANGYRLPTEAQWEYAAKGGNGSPGSYTYSGSDTVGDVAWYWDNSDDKTHEVGKKAANGLGLYDMSGNVFEWCWDWYGNYSSGAQTDPTGAVSGADRVIRGGCWFIDLAEWAGSAFRVVNAPYVRHESNGFRLVRP
jgi:formylglycine-generating enzyme required for sulfatase activity